jgi:hypothetical protein
MIRDVVDIWRICWERRGDAERATCRSPSVRGSLGESMYGYGARLGEAVGLPMLYLGCVRRVYPVGKAMLSDDDCMGLRGGVMRVSNGATLVGS